MRKNLNVVKNFNPLNDYFMRYMLAKEGHEHILLNLINSVRADYNQETFEELNQPILERIVKRFRQEVIKESKRQEALIDYDIDEYDERFLRHLALGYTKEMIAGLKAMPFGVKSLEKRQNDLIGRLFKNEERVGVNATRLVVRALELRIIDIDNLVADEE